MKLSLQLTIVKLCIPITPPIHNSYKIGDYWGGKSNTYHNNKQPNKVKFSKSHTNSEIGTIPKKIDITIKSSPGNKYTIPFDTTATKPIYTHNYVIYKTDLINCLTIPLSKKIKTLRIIIKIKGFAGQNTIEISPNMLYKTIEFYRRVDRIQVVKRMKKDVIMPMIEHSKPFKLSTVVHIKHTYVITSKKIRKYNGQNGFYMKSYPDDKYKLNVMPNIGSESVDPIARGRNLIKRILTPRQGINPLPMKSVAPLFNPSNTSKTRTTDLLGKTKPEGRCVLPVSSTIGVGFYSIETKMMFRSYVNKTSKLVTICNMIKKYASMASSEPKHKIKVRLYGNVVGLIDFLKRSLDDTFAYKRNPTKLFTQHLMKYPRNENEIFYYCKKLMLISISLKRVKTIVPWLSIVSDHLSERPWWFSPSCSSIRRILESCGICIGVIEATRGHMTSGLKALGKMLLRDSKKDIDNMHKYGVQGISYTDPPPHEVDQLVATYRFATLLPNPRNYFTFLVVCSRVYYMCYLKSIKAVADYWLNILDGWTRQEDTNCTKILSNRLTRSIDWMKKTQATAMLLETIHCFQILLVRYTINNAVTIMSSKETIIRYCSYLSQVHTTVIDKFKLEMGASRVKPLTGIYKVNKILITCKSVDSVTHMLRKLIKTQCNPERVVEFPYHISVY